MGRTLSGERPSRRSRQLVSVASPAAGSDWSLTIPGGHIYRVLAVTAKLVNTSGGSARQPDLIVGNGSTTYLRIPPAATLAASSTGYYTWADRAPQASAGTSILSFLPALDLIAGYTLGTDTANIAAGDQWSGVYLYVIDSQYAQGPDGIVDTDELLTDILVALLQ